MKKLRIRNWDKWQSYRRDRGQPPWIKVHRQIMRDIEWVAMTDTQRGQLVAIWLLAADHDGVIPASPELVQKLCFMSDIPDLQFFIDQGFIDGDVKLTPERRQEGGEVTHQSRDRVETETEKETEPKGSDADASLAEKIWGEGLKAMCRMSGQPDRKLRGVIGKWRKDHGDQAVLDAITRAEQKGVSDPVPWVTAALGTKADSQMPGWLAGCS